ncbi:MAG TPA: SDR family NAD(P)-dependent oxidoreductase [Myxococcales bacterium]|nr:SDR family NAD(P)-dependent oxidoreductase [Myxococcales bacterium]
MTGLPLDGRVALVTGASRGIGRAVALELADAGADLVLCSTRAHGCRPTAREVMARKRRAVSVTADVASAADCDKLVRAAEEVFGRVDCLVNNAGIVQRAPVQDSSDQDFDRVLAVNLHGPFYLCRRVIPGMVRRRHGRIVNVSSISSRMGTSGLVSYCASKWGLNGLTQALAAELRGTGVTACAVLPGSVDTDMLKGSGYAPDVTPGQVAQVVRYLVAEAPEAMTGSLVEVFG